MCFCVFYVFWGCKMGGEIFIEQPEEGDSPKLLGIPTKTTIKTFLLRTSRAGTPQGITSRETNRLVAYSSSHLAPPVS